MRRQATGQRPAAAERTGIGVRLTLFPRDSQNPDRRRQMLFAVRWRGLNPPHNIHASHNSSERRKSLTVRIPLAAKIERRLVADAHEEIRYGGVRSAAGHGNSPIPVRKASDGSTFEGYRGKVLRAGCTPGLNHFDPDLIVRLIVGLDGPVKCAAVIKPGVDIAEEVSRRNGRMNGIDLNFDVAEFRFYGQDDRAGLRGSDREQR
jgi:hypothetical protein